MQRISIFEHSDVREQRSECLVPSFDDSKRRLRRNRRVFSRLIIRVLFSDEHDPHITHRASLWKRSP
jgi:hypothetical protein